MSNALRIKREFKLAQNLFKLLSKSYPSSEEFTSILSKLNADNKDEIEGRYTHYFDNLRAYTRLVKGPDFRELKDGAWSDLVICLEAFENSINKFMHHRFSKDFGFKDIENIERLKESTKQMIKCLEKEYEQNPSKRMDRVKEYLEINRNWLEIILLILLILATLLAPLISLIPNAWPLPPPQS